MNFYQRYAEIAEKKDLDPCSQKAADLFGVTKAAISSWNIKNTTPKGDTVKIIADKLGVSADYLLGRCEDSTDYTKRGQKITQFPQTGESKTVDISMIQKLYDRLDAIDRIKAEGVLQGMLMQDKYMDAPVLNAAHTRTDICVTQDMIDHDNAIMDDDDF